MLLKLNDTGDQVVLLQKMLNIKADGVFGNKTLEAVKKFQSDNHLTVDGIIGNRTWSKIMSLKDLFYEEYFLKKGEYSDKTTSKEYLFIHHTAGWNDPYQTIDIWENDNGMIATEFVIGGQKITNNNKKHDGKILQAFPTGYYAWHLGDNGNLKMHRNSVGIELNNFGYLVDGKTYTGTTADKSQIIELNEPFRGFTSWHKYSDEQLKSLKKLILFIADRDNIDVRSGLPTLIKTFGARAFEFNNEAYYGRMKGLWTHTNTRKDKTDCSPQPNLIQMLLDL